MSKKRFDYLLQQYLSGQIREDEKKEFLLFIQLMDDESLEKKFSSHWEGYEAKHILSEIRSKEIFETIQGHTHKTKKGNLYLRIISVAATITLLLLGGFWAKQKFFPSNQAIHIYAKVVPSEQAVTYNRNLILADGSHVVLKAGSKLSVSSDFNHTKRIVKLIGEAYFDIVHDKNKPFVIETGQVKTTVLGTAFNIKAWPHDQLVNVSVTRGRVRVDDKGKLLAVLTTNQTIDYRTNNTKITKQDQSEQVETATRWIGSDLQFDHITFLDIASTLSKRYGVDIRIENKQIANMLLVSYFEGTESLSEVLDILCSVNQNMSYTLKNNTVIISYSDSQQR